MLYRSEATVPFGESELYDLADGARVRNRRKRVTGALFYEGGKFFQWLEGPRGTVNDLFDRIGRDPRHSDVELVSVGRTKIRVFADWNLRLFRDRRSIPYRLPLADPCDDCQTSCDVARAAARDLTRGDDRALRNVLDEASGQLDVQVCFVERLMRGFTELWANDECEHAEVVIGQALALAAFRHAVLSETSNVFPNCDRQILVSPLPGEPHYLRATLATTMLSAAGYPTRYLPAVSDAELVRELESSRYMGLVLVAGDAFLSTSQEHGLRALCDRLIPRSGAKIRTAIYGRLPATSRGLDDVAGIDRLCASALRLPDVFDRRASRVH